MYVIGTAGHVDHGKSTLVKRLTGIDPDRLAEEKARQMTIDLGFAWFDLPQSGRVGVIDVPGHRDFIENMLAGIGGVDLALLVIAADEGPMPQTREHLAILDLLGIHQAVVALTKVDAASDPEWLALVQADIEALLSEKHLASTPIVPVSSLTGFGIEQLKRTLDELLCGLSDTNTTVFQPNLPRLPVDRVFSMTGFGTVVTGTLRGSSLEVDDIVEILPARFSTRIRGIQAYEQTVEHALPGSRVALNLSGVERGQVKRGDVIAPPGIIEPSWLIDARYHHLPEAGFDLKHNAIVKVFTGTAETTARIRLLETEIIAPGSETWVQLQLDRPIAALDGDPFILRRPSPPQTVGGGTFIRVHPHRKWKRGDQAVIAALIRYNESRCSAQQLPLLAETHDPLSRHELQRRSALSNEAFDVRLKDALERGWLIAQARSHDTLIWSAGKVDAGLRSIEDQLAQYHRSFPLRAGMPREELRSRLKLKPDTLQFLLNASDAFVQEGSLVRLRDHVVTFSPTQQHQREQVLEWLGRTPFAPPSLNELLEAYDQELIYAMIDLGDLVRVHPDIVFARAAYDSLTQQVTQTIRDLGSVSVAQIRDQLQTSRKYAIAFLEHLDSVGWTRRQGDVRVAGPRFSPG
ncbi:MAG: selenocysteine-specific translation elongation factor [Anaerolinea sp.]|nr:selenocysteine-specific translation elongation factor [Anaerolinea sp.]